MRLKKEIVANKKHLFLDDVKANIQKAQNQSE